MISRKSPMPLLLAVVFCLALAGCTALQQRWQARQALRTADRLDAQGQPLAPDTLLDAAIAHYGQRRITPYAKLARAYYYRGRMHRAARRYPQAMHDFAQARQHFTRRTPPALQGRTAANIAFLCASQGNDSLARVYYTEALDWFAQARDTSRTAYTLLDLGGVELRSGHPDRSLHYCRQVLPLAQDSMLHGNVLQCLGKAWYKLGELDSTFHCMSQAIHYPCKNNSLGIRYLYIAYCYYDWQMLDSAAVYAQKAIDSTTDPNVHYGAYYMLEDWAVLHNDVHAHDRYSALRSDAQRFIGEQTKQLTEAVGKIPLELMTRQNIRLQSWITVLCLFLLLCIGYAWWKYWTYRQLHAENERAKEELRQKQTQLQHSEEQRAKASETREQRLQHLQQQKERLLGKEWKAWENVEHTADLILNGFFIRLQCRHPGLDEKEKRMCLLVLLNCSQREMADLLFLSTKSIGSTKRRLAQKLGTTSAGMWDYLLKFIGGD